MGVLAVIAANQICPSDVWRGVRRFIGGISGLARSWTFLADRAEISRF